MTTAGDRVLATAVDLDKSAATKSERDALVRLVNILGPNRWISTTSKYPVFEEAELHRSPCIKPGALRDGEHIFWASKGDWFLSEAGGISRYIALVETDSKKLYTVNTLDDVDTMICRFGATSVPTPLPCAGLPPCTTWRFRPLQLYRWDMMSRTHSGFAMPNNLRNIKSDVGWGVEGMDTSTLVVWNPSCLTKAPVVWDLSEAGAVADNGFFSIEHTVLPLVAAELEGCSL